MGLTFSAITSEHGAVYKDGGQGVKDLIAFLHQPSVTEKYWNVFPTQNTTMQKASMEFVRVLQRYQKAFTTVGGITFKPREIPLYDLKIDSSLTPRDLQDQWLGFLASKGLKPAEMPITKYYQEYLISQAISDYELLEVFAGVRGSVTPGTATASGTSVNGLRKQINDGITATTINELVLGAVPTDTIDCLDYFEAFAAGIESADKLIYDNIDYIFCNTTVAKRFMQGNRDRYNLHYAQQEDLSKVNMTNIQVVGLPSMGTSTKLFATPAVNRARYTKNESQERLFDVQVADREVKFLTDFWKGLGFWIDEWVYTNDVDKA